MTAQHTPDYDLTIEYGERFKSQYEYLKTLARENDADCALRDAADYIVKLRRAVEHPFAAAPETAAERDLLRTERDAAEAQYKACRRLRHEAYDERDRLRASNAKLLAAVSIAVDRLELHNSKGNEQQFIEQCYTAIANATEKE